MTEAAPSLARDIMTTQVLTLHENSTLTDAIRLIVEIDIGGLIVVNDAEEVIGVISEKDLMVAYDMLGGLKAPIQDYLKREVISVTEDTPIEEVSRLLVEKNVKRVAVINDKKAVGVISRKDILRHIYKKEKKHS